ncbi:MAG TPA: hypothetical protein VLA52_07145 [Thermohalobaculum sp.]|nr:hypothetical protein [Thermohalobaculum sp.]
MSKAPFPIDPVLTGITLAYRNRALIADSVLPRLTPMGKEEFKYKKWNIEEGFTIPDTKVGRKSEPNEVEFAATEVTASTEDYGLDDIIPFNDIANAAGSLDPVGHATEMLTDLVLLDREVRVAGLVFAAATYDTGLKVQLSGTSQWSDFVNSDPIGDIQAGLDAPIMRPNVMVIGRPAFSKLIQHPDINKAVNGTAGDTGIVRRNQIAELFELDEVVVGEPFQNTAKKGQTASYARVWGKHAALIHRDPLATSPMSDRVTFGWTAQYGTRVAGQIAEPKKGIRGSIRVRVGEGVKEVIVASQTGYFIEDAVA